ncbi:hypothetical protein Tsp_06772 [Trichinella spiralis]|nr:hypothetical protein Tsp_06772 [Trichinella spiralis]
MHKWMIIACSLDPSVLALSKLNGFSDLAFAPSKTLLHQLNYYFNSKNS